MIVNRIFYFLMMLMLAVFYFDWRMHEFALKDAMVQVLKDDIRALAITQDVMSRQKKDLQEFESTNFSILNSDLRQARDKLDLMLTRTAQQVQEASDSTKESADKIGRQDLAPRVTVHHEVRVISSEYLRKDAQSANRRADRNAEVARQYREYSKKLLKLIPRKNRAEKQSDH